MGQARPGQPLRISSQTWNAVERLVGNRPAAGYAPPIGFPPHNGSILIRNRSSDGETRKRFEVLAVRTQNWGHDDTCQQEPYFDGTTPVWPDDMGAIAVLQEPLAYNAIGRALVSGITIARWKGEPGDSESGLFADFHDGEYFLRARPMGGARPFLHNPGLIGDAYMPVVLGTVYLPTYHHESDWGYHETKTDVTITGYGGPATFNSVEGGMVASDLGTTQLIISTFLRKAEGVVTNAVGCME